MAVLDTDTFSLQDVVDEINPTTDDLQDCINDAIEGNYDTNYYTAPATSLLEFRNYGNTGTSPVLRYSTETYSGTIYNSWQNPNNINQIAGETSDYVFKDAFGSRPTSTLVGRRFNFNIPLNATIDGLVVKVRKRVETAGKAKDRYIQFYNSTFIGTNKASTTLYDSNYVTTEYGGPNDLWGLTLTPNMLNSDTFSLVMQATWVDNGAYNVYIQWMTVEVYYTIT
jgi:hypothetical protein